MLISWESYGKSNVSNVKRLNKKEDEEEEQQQYSDSPRACLELCL